MASAIFDAFETRSFRFIRCDAFEIEINARSNLDINRIRQLKPFFERHFMKKSKRLISNDEGEKEVYVLKMSSNRVPLIKRWLDKHKSLN
jgi:hypothetical protein